MMQDRVVRYLSRLDGVKVANTHDSGSHYFKIGDAKIRVSNHFATKFNCPQTLNIVCEREEFVVTFGNKLLPVHTYDALKNLLRTFVMVCDILVPLTDVRQQVKVVEKIVEKPVVVSTPNSDSKEWIWVGDLSETHRKSAKSVIDNMRKFAKKKGK